MRTLAGEAARYAVAGGAAFVLDFALFIGLVRGAGLHYLLAAPLAFAAGLLVVYALSVRWVFAQRRFADARVEFALFAAIGLGGMLLNEAVLYAAVDGARFPYEGAKLLSAALVFGFNFGLRKLFLFTAG